MMMPSMRLRHALVAMLLLCFPVAMMAQMKAPVQFSYKEKKISDTEIEVVFTGKVDAGWHVYTTDIADDGPTRATITLESVQGLKAKGSLQTRGKVIRHMDDMFGMELSYMEGTAVFAQRFTITGEEYDVKGYLTYGACNDENCIPPTDVDFHIKGKGLDKADEKATEPEAEEQPAADTAQAVTDTTSADTAAVAPAATGGDLWASSIEELKAFEEKTDSSLIGIFLLGLLGGFVALLTPCVWPIIPMTVSFFLKRSQSRRKGIIDASIYGLSIVVIYVLLGTVVTLLCGANALNSLSTNAFFNIFFFLMLLVFAASFFGWFELTLPSSWSSAVDSKAEKTTGLLSIFLMAFTLCLVSFSCTGPIIGFLLVEVGTSNSILGPTIGMLGFAIALALPFTLFAMFPSWLKSAPKSGNWMNCIKVSLGFLELAFSLKFLSVADLAYGWHILDREVFLSLWIVIFALLGAYLIGWLRFPHDEDEYDEMGEVIVNHRTSVPRFFMALGSFAFAIYMIPGLWGAPCKAVSAFAPPMNTQDFSLYEGEVQAKFTDYEEGMRYAREHNKPVMLDFTGFGCVNCRKMEASVWTDPRVASLINDEYVLISLYVDDKTPLPAPIQVQENGSQRTLRSVGDRWSYLQSTKFGANTQPFYVLVDAEGHPLAGSYSYDEDVSKFIKWLER